MYEHFNGCEHLYLLVDNYLEIKTINKSGQFRPHEKQFKNMMYTIFILYTLFIYNYIYILLLQNKK